MRPPIPVTTRSAMAVNGSAAKATSTCSVPMWIQGKRSARSRRSAGGRPASCTQTATDSRNDTPTVAQAIQPTGPLPRRFWSHAPPSPSTTAPASGSSGMSASHGAATGAAACSVMQSAAQPIGRVHVDGLEHLVDAEHDGEPDGRFRGGEHDDEDREHLSVVRGAGVAPERHVVDVGRVQDELDAHQDAERVAAGDDAEQPEAEDHRAQDDEVRDGQVLHQPFTSLRDTITAPISTTSSTREAISNGRMKSVRNALPTP